MARDSHSTHLQYLIYRFSGQFTQLKTASSLVCRELTKNEDSFKDSNKSVSSEYECVLCGKTHKQKGIVLLSLSQCPDFKRMDVPHRISVLDTNGFCKKCLRDKNDGLHINGCAIAKERKILCNKCKPPSSSHHPMIHWEKEVSNSDDEQNYFISYPDNYDEDNQDSETQEDFN